MKPARRQGQGGRFLYPRGRTPSRRTTPHAVVSRAPAGRSLFLARFLPQISLRNLRKLDCYANRNRLRPENAVQWITSAIPRGTRTSPLTKRLRQRSYVPATASTPRWHGDQAAVARPECQPAVSDGPGRHSPHSQDRTVLPAIPDRTLRCSAAPNTAAARSVRSRYGVFRGVRDASSARVLPCARGLLRTRAQLSPLPRRRSIAARARSLASRRSSGATAASTGGAAAGTAVTGAAADGCTGDGRTTLTFSRGAGVCRRGSAGMLAVSTGVSAGLASADFARR